MPLDPTLKTLNKNALAELKKSGQARKLTIVVGAGASIQSGLPSWYGLLERLVASYTSERYEKGKNPLKHLANEIRSYLLGQLEGQSPIVFAQYLQSYFQKNPDRFLRIVHRALYGTLASPPKPGPIAVAIADLASRLNAVVVFNYDDLIEQALEEKGVACTSVCNASDWGAVAGIPVYHPHGFMPYKFYADRGIVLSEVDYHTQYANPFAWSNLSVATSLLESTCLFVSTSLTDPNMRRLLDFVHRENRSKRHYFFWGRPVPGAIQGMDALQDELFQDLFVKSFDHLGLSPLWFFLRPKPNTYDDVPELLREILKA